MPVNFPGAYIQEIPSVHTIDGVPTSITAFLGRTTQGVAAEPVPLSSVGDFERVFGRLHPDAPLGYAVHDFFNNGGTNAIVIRAGGVPTGAVDAGALAAGLDVLERVDLFNLLCILPDTRGGDVPDAVYRAAATVCEQRRAFLIVDSKAAWRSVDQAQAGVAALNLIGQPASNAAVYFPRLLQADAMNGGAIDSFPASGAIAGVFARTDAQRGVWTAPAGIEAAILGATGLEVSLAGQDHRVLNSLGINSLRQFPPQEPVVWGARTMRGADALADEYKYVPVRRTALFIEESLRRGLSWAVFEPDGEPLRNQIRTSVGAFMYGLFKAGAFQGRLPQEAFFVKCDASTTTQSDIAAGVVNVLVGFAPLKPSEFVVIRIGLSRA